MEKKYLMGGAAAVIIIVVLALALIVVPQINGNMALQGETNKVRVGYTPLAHHAPLYMAIEKGYFAEAGIEIELSKFDSPNQITDAIQQGKIDFTGQGIATGIAAVADYKNPGKVKLYMLSGGTTDHPSARLLIHKDSVITSIEELKGTKMGILGSSIQWRTVARELLAQNNLEADKDVILVELAAGMQVQALASKQIDSLLALDPMGTMALQTGIAKVLEQNPAEKVANGNTWLGTGAVNAEFLKKNPTTAKKFVEIMERAVKEIRENPEEATKYLSKYTPITAEIAPKIVVPQYRLCSEIGESELKDLQSFLDIFTKYGIVDGKINGQEMLNCN